MFLRCVGVLLWFRPVYVFRVDSSLRTRVCVGIMCLPGDRLWNGNHVAIIIRFRAL